jgi:hypothetical protein
MNVAIQNDQVLMDVHSETSRSFCFVYFTVFFVFVSIRSFNCHMLNVIFFYLFRLNEGFATFAGNQAVDHLFPMWNVWTRFVSSYTFSYVHFD